MLKIQKFLYQYSPNLECRANNPGITGCLHNGVRQEECVSCELQNSFALAASKFQYSVISLSFVSSSAQENNSILFCKKLTGKN